MLYNNKSNSARVNVLEIFSSEVKIMLTMADDGEAELFSKLEKIKEIRYFFNPLATYKICLVTFMQESI